MQRHRLRAWAGIGRHGMRHRACTSTTAPGRRSPPCTGFGVGLCARVLRPLWVHRAASPVIALTALTLTLLATLYPSYRASRVQPAKVLRVEITFCQGLSKTFQQGYIPKRLFNIMRKLSQSTNSAGGTGRQVAPPAVGDKVVVITPQGQDQRPQLRRDISHRVYLT